MVCPLYGKGVPRGGDEEFPRTPVAFEPKVKWELGDADGVKHLAENYGSVKQNLPKLREMFHEEVGEGFLRGPMRMARALRLYPGLIIAACGALAKDLDGGLRVIFDGTHEVRLNHRIKVRDTSAFPGLGEARGILRWLKESGRRYLAFKGDVKAAHRRIKVDRKDHLQLGCRLTANEVYINLVGTFGIASASYWWQRLIGILARGVYYLMEDEEFFFQLLYADDFLWLVPAEAPLGPVAMIVFFLTALGVP